ncbi:transglutaminase TgpA family protein [Bacillus tuaregi]|uniref:transglutaminase TgpA family protein n=1 Tax=Bacillus tuaregi TaxID=1816695 RepID=UPI0008F82B96|nr:transglutaminaseTgpA domain-containing protein [Bacillus tuaregi]
MSKWKDITSILLYSLGFLMLLEWIWPINALSETAAVGVFILFILVCLLLFILQTPLFASILLKIAVMIYLLHSLYFEESILQFRWIPIFIEEIKTNTLDVFNGNWLELSHLYRSLAFFILLWMMVYLLEYWLFKRKQIFIFFFMTLVYITFLDTFTPYDASGAIVRIILIGFLMVGILTFQRYSSKERLRIERTVIRKWALWLSIMVLFSAFLGFSLPKFGPIWPDPIPYLKVFNGLGTAKTVGYGEDDTQLGGSITGDSSVVYQTIVEAPHYWKVETKDVYTGKGWIQSEEGNRRIRLWKNNDIPITSFVNIEDEADVQTSKVMQVKEYDHVVYPLGLKNVQTMGNYSYEIDPTIEKIYSVIGSQTVPLDSYTVTYVTGNYNEKLLQSIQYHHTNISPNLIARYTQLPDQLPKRVKELAEKITKAETGFYDKVKAVEKYLKTSDYSYSLQDVAIPGEDMDYVDQFLFDTMQGYCDNFSTSMVVLLRSIDIPARWVKGYTEGRYKGMEGDLYKYEITNNNAHSWVEVFFPQVGWVPFEPTPGFTHSTDQSVEEEEIEPSETTIQPEQQEEQVQQDANEPEEKVQKKKEDKVGSISTARNNVEEALTANIMWLILLALLLLLIVFYVYHTRSRWLPIYYIRKYKSKEDDADFITAYAILLRQLRRCGMARRTGQTLRDYAKMIDERYESVEMGTLTERYEQYLYGKHLPKGTWSEMKELWENLIKRTMS